LRADGGVISVCGTRGEVVKAGRVQAGPIPLDAISERTAKHDVDAPDRGGCLRTGAGAAGHEQLAVEAVNVARLELRQTEVGERRQQIPVDDVAGLFDVFGEKSRWCCAAGR